MPAPADPPVARTIPPVISTMKPSCPPPPPMPAEQLPPVATISPEEIVSLAAAETPPLSSPMPGAPAPCTSKRPLPCITTFAISPISSPQFHSPVP